MKTATTLALLTLGLAGCYSVNTVQTAAPAARRHIVTDKRVVWDDTLAGKLQVGQIIDATAAGNLRRIQADVTNRYAYAIDFAYKVEWFDRQGMKLQSPVGGWKRLHLEAHESSTVSEIAVSPDAVDFVLKFQESKGSNSIL